MNDIYKKMRLLDYVDFLRENCENRRCHNCIFKEKKVVCLGIKFLYSGELMIE